MLIWKEPVIYPSTKIVGRDSITFGHNVLIDDFVFIYAKEPVSIGNFVHIASYVSITGGAEFTMKDFSWISSGSRIFTGSDDLIDWGFGSPVIPQEYRNVTRKRVRVERFVCIGANSVILPGVTLGEGCSVGAGSVVSKDLDPWGIYINNKKINTRNKNAVLETYEKFLEELKENDSLLYNTVVHN